MNFLPFFTLSSVEFTAFMSFMSRVSSGDVVYVHAEDIQKRVRRSKRLCHRC